MKSISFRFKVLSFKCTCMVLQQCGKSICPADDEEKKSSFVLGNKHNFLSWVLVPPRRPSAFPRHCVECESRDKASRDMRGFYEKITTF